MKKIEGDPYMLYLAMSAMSLICFGIVLAVSSLALAFDEKKIRDERKNSIPWLTYKRLIACFYVGICMIIVGVILAIIRAIVWG